MEATLLNVVILIPSYSFAGSLAWRGERLSDVLNDRRDSFVHLQNVQMYRLHGPSKLVAKHATAVVPKEEIVLAFEAEGPSISSTKRLYRYVKKERLKVFLLVDEFQVSGTIYTGSSSARPDVYKLITNSGERFVPLTQASVVFPFLDGATIQQDAVIANVQRIRYIAECAKEE